MRCAEVKSAGVFGALAALAMLVLALLVPAFAVAGSGDLLWAKGVELGLAREEFLDLAKGPDGSVYAVGRANYDAGKGDILVARFSSAGKPLWRKVFDGAAHGDDCAYAVAVDAAGNAFVTGMSVSAANGSDAVTLKYSKGGTKRWVKLYNGMANAYDGAVDIALDPSGRAYVALTSTVMGGENIVVAKYGSGGALLWDGMWAGPGEDDWARAIAVDARGSAYVVGATDTPATKGDAVIIRFKATGDVKWSSMYDYDAHLADWGADVVLRGDYAYLGGVTARVGGRFCFLAAKYSRADGALKWARVSDIAVAGDVDSSAGLVVDGDGNVSVGGPLTVPGPELKRGAVVQWNRNGVFRWEQTFYRPATGGGAGFAALAGGPTGAVYGAGWVRRGTAQDSVVVKYRRDGTRVWTRPFNSDPYEVAQTGCLLLAGGSNGGLYGGGILSVGGPSYSALLLKYRP